MVSREAYGEGLRFISLTFKIITMTIKLEKKHLIIGVSVVVLCVVMCVGWHFYSVNKFEKNATEFKARTSSLLLPMSFVLDDYQKNWRSAIFDKEAYDETGFSRYCSDFNTAISWRKEAMKHLTNLIGTYLYDIEDLLKEMDNPPSKYEKVYDKFVTIYNNLYKLKKQCQSPEGSLQTFSQNINDLVSDIGTDLNETDLTIPKDIELMTKYTDEFTKSLEVVTKALKD